MLSCRRLHGGGKSEIFLDICSCDRKYFPGRNMLPEQTKPESTTGPTAAAVIQPSSSPRFLSSVTTTSRASSSPFDDSHRKIAIAVDLSEESAFAVRWAVQNYLRPGDSVILLHVRPTSVFYGADWGSVDLSVERDEESQKKLEDDFDVFTNTKAIDLGQPLVEAQIPFKIHIVKDRDMKERLCLEVERLGLSAVIMGSRGFGASKRISTSKERLGSVSDYCVRHCVCPVVVVRFADEKNRDNRDVDDADVSVSKPEEVELHPVPEEEEEEEEQDYHDASDEQKGN